MFFTSPVFMLIGHMTVFKPTYKSCLHFSFYFMGFHCFTCINLELIRSSLWQPRFHVGILLQEIKSAVFWNYGIDIGGVHIPYCLLCHKLSLCQIWCFYHKVHNSCKILHESAGLPALLTF